MSKDEEMDFIDYVITENNEKLAIVIRNGFKNDGITFFTDNSCEEQVAYMTHKKGHIIIPHVHNNIKREINYTREVLIMRKGTLECDFYTQEKILVQTLTISEGDILVLLSGGHGFKCLDEVEMVEIKNGPFVGDGDKTRF
jgi:uncharacterized protein with PhoU and TrkA domain